MNHPMSASRAEELWLSGDALEAGKILASLIPVEKQPTWALACLRFELKETGLKEPVMEEVERLAENPKKWPESHSVFDKVRRRTLELDAIAKQGPLTRHEMATLHALCVAEVVVKTCYNATGAYDSFDEDSSWGLAVLLRDFADFWAMDNFRLRAWGVLSSGIRA